MGFFAQDLISLTPELKMMLGMRYDQYNFPNRPIISRTFQNNMMIRPSVLILALYGNHQNNTVFILHTIKASPLMEVVAIFLLMLILILDTMTLNLNTMNNMKLGLRVIG